MVTLESPADADATLISQMELSCPLPPSPVMADAGFTGEQYGAVTLDISISNDGTAFSDTASMTVFDSLCMTCANATSCNQKVTQSVHYS